MQALRICWGPQRTATFHVKWDAVRWGSYVVVTASEGMEEVEQGVVLLTSTSPHRFIGNARFTVCNIAPQQHELSFHVRIEFNHPLMLWTDIVLFDDITEEHKTQIAEIGSQSIEVQ